MVQIVILLSLCLTAAAIAQSLTGNFVSGAGTSSSTSYTMEMTIGGPPTVTTTVNLPPPVPQPPKGYVAPKSAQLCTGLPPWPPKPGTQTVIGPTAVKRSSRLVIVLDASDSRAMAYPACGNHSKEANYMSPAGWTRWQIFQKTQKWVDCEEVTVICFFLNQKRE